MKAENVGTVVSLDPKSTVLGLNMRRHGLKDQPVNDLMDRIRREGQLQPIRVWQDGEGKYHMILGYRRLKACMELGVNVNAIVCPRPDPKDEADMNFSENQGRASLSSAEIADYAIHCHKLGRKNVETAALIGCTPNYVSMLLHIDKLCEPGKELLHRGLLGVAAAIIIAKMSKAEQLAECEKIEAGKMELDNPADPLLGDNAARGNAKGRDDEEPQETSSEDEGGDAIDRVKPIAVKDVKDLLANAIADKSAASEVIPTLTVLLAFCEKRASEKDFVAATRGNHAKVLDRLEKAKEKAKKEAEKAKEEAAEARERKAEETRAKNEEADKAAIEKLLAAGWTHVKGNTNRWSAPGETGNVKLTTTQALMALMVPGIHEMTKP